MNEKHRFVISKLTNILNWQNFKCPTNPQNAMQREFKQREFTTESPCMTYVHRRTTLTVHFVCKDTTRYQYQHAIYYNYLLCSLHDFFELFILNHNMKALVILSHSWSPFLPLTCLYGKQPFVGICAAFRNIFWRKASDQITHANHMTMTTGGQILSRPD